MVKLKTMNNILTGDIAESSIQSGLSLKEIVEKYADSGVYDGMMAECYNAETGETTYVPMEDCNDVMSVIVTVDGQEKPLEYVPSDGDCVYIVTIPASAKQGIGAALGFAIGAVVGIFLLAAAFPLVAAGAAAIGLTVNAASWTAAFWIGVAGFALAGAVIGFALTGEKKQESNSKESSGLPNVSGSKNQSIIGNQIPMVIGRHLIVPFIAGSPYVEYSDYRGGTEYITSLYVAGYAPLRLTDLKFDDLLVAHNQDFSSTTRNSVLKGMIRGVDPSDNSDTGQIAKKWSLNDVSIEILQQNQSAADEDLDYGTLYNKTVIQNEGKSTPLYIYDMSISKIDDTLTYHGQPFTNGMRTNSIRFSEQCPKKVSVTLDFSSGLYGARSENGTNKYYTIPCWVAVQWRIYNSGAGDTGGNVSGESQGWHSFETIKDTNVSASIFKGSDYTNSASLHYGNSMSYTVTDSNELASLVNQGYLHQAQIPVAPGSKYTAVGYVSDVWWLTCSSYATGQTVTRFSTEDTGWIGAKVFNMQKVEGYICSKKGLESGNAYNNEFRVTTEVDLSSYASEILASTNTTKCIEVRVVRVDPCYINQTKSVSDKIGPTTYQDAFSWLYLTTETFDESIYKSTGQVTARRPLSCADLKKLCLVAIRVKADSVQNITGQMSKFSCIAESFSPTWNSTTKSWIPASVVSTKKYYSALSNGTRTEITKAQFEAARQNGEKAICVKGGNDYVNNISNDIFTNGITDTITVDSDGYISSSGTTYTRYVLGSEVKNKYICANSASGIMLACVGGHLGRDALGYDAINLPSVGELFEDCSDMTDGTPDETSADGLLHIPFNCNAYVYQSVKLEDMISKICTTARAAYVIENNKLFVVQDKSVPYSVGALNQQNVISGTNTMSYEQPPSGIQVQFADEDDGYNQNVVYAMSDGESRTNPKNSIQQMNFEWVTSVNQIWSLSRYALANIEMQKEVLTRKISIDGYTIGFGNVVEVTDDTLLIGDGSGRITGVLEDGNYIYGLMIDTPYEYKGTVDPVTKLCKQGVEIIQAGKYGESRVAITRLCTLSGIIHGTETLVPTVGMTNRILFESKITKDEYRNSVDSEGNVTYVQYLPQIGDIVAIGEMGKISAKYRVKKITPDKSGKYDLTLIQYNEQLFKYGKEIPTFQNHMTIPDRSTGDTYNLGESVSSKDLQNQITESSGIAESNAVKKINEGTASEETTPDAPTLKSVTALRDGIYSVCNEFSAGLKNSIKVMTWQIQKGANAGWITVGTSTTGSFTYPFDRTTDGYPEASVLKNWSVRVSIENIYSVSSDFGESLSVDTDSYGTWIPQSPSASGTHPSITSTVNKRTVTLRISQPASSLTLYGTVSYGITIERSNPSADTKFYVPNLTEDPYGSVDNYKDASATEPVWVSGSFSQTLPLYGQDGVMWKLQYSSGGTVVKTGYTSALTNLPTSDFIAVPSTATKTTDETTGYITWTWTDSSTGYVYTYAQESMPDPQNTTYLYRIQTKNVTTGAVISTTADVSVTVSPSTVEDIVNAAITENKLANDAVTTDKLAAGTVTAEKIFVKALSAITANLGQMSSGAIFGDANNYHILTEGTYTDPNTGVTSSYKAGEFKVGNSNGDYLQCKNNDDGTYTISLKSSAFQITSTGVDINGTIYAYENTGALAESTSLRRVVVSANGITLQRRESTLIPWSQATDVAKLIGDKYGNLLLTNDSTYAPSYVTPRRATDVIYHLDGNTLDTTGANTEGVDGYGAYETGEVWTPDDKGKELNGFIRKNVGTSTYKSVAFWCKGKKFDACGNIINLNLFTSTSDVTNTNKRMTSDKTKWGLTAAQVSAGVVKYYQD